MIEAIELQKSYGRLTAVESLSFKVQAGEFVGLVGPNGAGKSTTIKMLAGQIFPTSGSAFIAGLDTRKDPNGARKNLGYVPENPDLYDYLTAKEMIQFVAEIRGEGDVEWALSLTGLGTDADRQISEYSQGMRRKTAIACALVSRPKVIILDESLNGLDPPSVSLVLSALDELRSEGSTVLLSTHVLDTLEKIGTRIIMLKSGKLIADSDVSKLDELRKLF